MLVGTSPSEYYHLIGAGVVGEGAVGAVGGTGAGGVNLGPDLLGGMVGPEVVHVVGVWVRGEVPA